MFPFSRPARAHLFGFLAGFICAAPASAFGCACGCSVFDVGTSTLLPDGPGGTAFLQYAFLNQTTNWNGNGSAPSADNDDKHIRSDFVLAGIQYMFNERWGAMAEVPLTHRVLVTAEEDHPGTFRHTALGDVRLMAVYSGFVADMSTGLVAGIKLPTGDHTFADFEPDVQIGTGSTDVLLGGYHTGALTLNRSWTYIVQGIWQHRIATQDQYQPGAEINVAAGVSHAGVRIGSFNVAPVFQFLVSNRGRDGGAAGDRENTGYTRLLAAPGVAFSKDVWKLYADVEIAVWQHVNGNQLIAPAAFKLTVSRTF